MGVLKTAILFCVLIAVVTPAYGVTYATIDRMTIRPIGGYLATYSPGTDTFQISGLAYQYFLSDGTSWNSGAGSSYIVSTHCDHVVRTGTTLSYHLALATGSRFYKQTDYDSGDHSAQGELKSVGPLVLQAQLGSNTGTITGYALLASNDMTWYGQPRFNYYSASVGEWVPFSVTCTLSGTTFSQSLFDSTFKYTYAGEVTFSDAIPEPATLGLLALGGLMMSKYRARGV